MSILKTLRASSLPEPLACITVPPLEPAFSAASITSSAFPFSTIVYMALYIFSPLLIFSLPLALSSVPKTLNALSM